MIQHFGYAALFFALWLGIVGMPIPDEVVVMTGGALTATGALQLIPAFLLTYFGVISGLSLGYVLGRFIGMPILAKLRRKKRIDEHLVFSEKLVQKYGSFALCISYFLPIVRHIVPYLVGINKMSFRRYAIFSYSTGFVWTLLFFSLGRFVGGHVQDVGYLVYHYGVKIVCFLVVLSLIAVFIRLSFRPKKV
jgi:Uncharacterized membrane-associated protein